MPERVDDLFGEYAEAYARGEQGNAHTGHAKRNKEALSFMSDPDLRQTDRKSVV